MVVGCEFTGVKYDLWIMPLSNALIITPSQTYHYEDPAYPRRGSVIWGCLWSCQTSACSSTRSSTQCTLLPGEQADIIWFHTQPTDSLPLTNPGWCITPLRTSATQWCPTESPLCDNGQLAPWDPHTAEPSQHRWHWSCNLGVEQAQHDGLESLAHAFMYFLCTTLPWQRLKAATNKQKI